MKEVFENIKERLEEKENEAVLKAPNTSDLSNKEYQKWMMKSYGFKDAIEIVNQVEEEFNQSLANNNQSLTNDGWILCSERLPEEHDSLFAMYKGTNKWDDAMFEKISDVVNVTVVDEKGKAVTTHAHTTDGIWHCDLLRCNRTYRIIAWQPLPEPYKGE